MTPTIPATVGHHKAGVLLATIVNDLHELNRLGVFLAPEVRESHRRCFAVMAASQELYDGDRRAGLHRGAGPSLYTPVPDDDLDDALPPAPVAAGAFPIGCDF